MITLVRKAFWLGLFLAFTLGFVTLFDFGIPASGSQFTTNAQSEIGDITKLFRPIQREKDKSDQVDK